MAVFTCHTMAASPEIVDISYGLWQQQKAAASGQGTKFIVVPMKICDIKGKAPTNYDSFVPLSVHGGGKGGWKLLGLLP